MQTYKQYLTSQNILSFNFSLSPKNDNEGIGRETVKKIFIKNLSIEKLKDIKLYAIFVL